jgi:mediator of RNA polymerase II transcription subunit 5
VVQASEFGINYPDSFVLKYLLVGRTARSVESMTEHENQLLGGWIKGLFETGHINDELLSICGPKDFHLLVATLFDQNLRACESQLLALDTLKGGFERKSPSPTHLIINNH